VTEDLHALLNSMLLLCVGSGLAGLSAWFWFQKNAAAKEAEAVAAAHAVLLARVAELETRERMASAAFLPIATAFQATLIKSLTHAHATELDALLVKVGNHALRPEEEPRLLALLAERAQTPDGRIGESEREDAEIFPVVMKRARAEQLLLAAALAAKVQPIRMAIEADRLRGTPQGP
jgi:hypothetical protein